MSHNNHFMYHSGGGRTGGKGKAAWRAPTTVEKMSYKKFKEAADRCDQNNCSETEQHFYFRVTAPAAGHFIFKELPFFKPKASIFIKVGSLATGRQCHARTASSSSSLGATQIATHPGSAFLSSGPATATHPR